MNRTMRKIHRWGGIFSLGFIIFYTVTGLTLNHRQTFGFFIDRQHRSSPAPAMDGKKVAKALAAYESACDEKKRPTVIRVRPDGTVELLYGSHGKVTYIFHPGTGTMERIEKKERQPLHWLNRLHKAAKTSTAWLVAADLAALLVLTVSISSLFIFRFRRADWLFLFSGGILLIIMVIMG